MLGRPVVIAVLVVVLMAACAHRPPDTPGVHQQELQQRQSDFLAAMSARDVERTAALFAEDAVVHVANMPPLQGRSAIHQFYGNVFRFLSSSASAPESLRMSSSGDMAYGTGRVNNVFAGQQGAVEYAGKYLLVWERRGGEWMIVVYSITNNSPEVSR